MKPLGIVSYPYTTVVSGSPLLCTYSKLSGLLAHSLGWRLTLVLLEQLEISTAKALRPANGERLKATCGCVIVLKPWRRRIYWWIEGVGLRLNVLTLGNMKRDAAKLSDA